MKARSSILLILSALIAGLPCAAQIVETHSFLNLNRAIPDGNASGLSDHQTVTSAIGGLSGLQVRLHLDGEFNGDLYGYLRHISGGTTNFCVLLNRVGRSAADMWGYADAGLNVTFSDTAANGNIHAYHAVTVPPAGTPLTGSWRPDGREVDPSVVLDTAPSTTSLATFNGANPNGEWTLFLADVDRGATNMLVSWELEIVGGSVPNVTWATPANVTYGTALSATQLNASSTVSGTFVYSPPAGVVLNAGTAQTLSVTFTPTDTMTYTPVTETVSLNVLPAPLTITANNAGKAYGAALPGFTASYTGFVLGQTAANLDTPVTFSTTASASSAVGSYPITPGGATDANYAITFVNGTLSVTAAPLTITANNAGKVYGAALPTFTATYTGFVPGESAANLDTPVTFSTTASASSAVGSYPITPGGATDANYAITFANGTLTITAASTTGTLASLANPATPGQSVTFSLQLNPVAPGVGIPSGTVQFIIDGSNTGNPAILGGGIANLSLTTLTAGRHTVAAAYAGDGNFVGTTNTLAQAQLINTTPVTVADTILRYPTDPTKVLVDTLLGNDSDADGNPIQLVSFTATTANGGTVARTGDWVHYTPAAGFTNDDSFTYTIEDSYNAQATATVTVRATADAVPAPNLVLTDLGNGSFFMEFDGIPGKTYRIQYAETLPNWQTLGNSTADDVGTFEYTDTPPPGTPARFYRSVYP